MSVKQSNDETFEIELKSTNPALFVWIEADGVKGMLVVFKLPYVQD